MRGRPSEERRRMFEIYKQRDWPKVWFNNFYYKYKKTPDADVYSLITPIELQNLKPIRVWKYKEIMEWYDEYEWEKPGPDKFRGRVARWLPKEEAIKVWEAWEEARQLRVLKAQIVKRQAREKKREQDELNWINKPQTPAFKRHRPIEDDYDPDPFRIDITYKPAEAKVIRDAYYRTLDELEDKINDIDNKEIKDELEFDYEFVEAQLALFNSYNK